MISDRTIKTTVEVGRRKVNPSILKQRIQKCILQSNCFYLQSLFSIKSQAFVWQEISEISHCNCTIEILNLKNYNETSKYLHLLSSSRVL